MLKNLASLSLIAGLMLTPGAQAQTSIDDSINQLSGTYQAEARYTLSENDVKSFVYQWFAAFDHQREPGYFLNRIAQPVDLNYPGTPIDSQAGFLKWYKGVTDNIVWNGHTIDGIKVSGNQAKGWDVAYVVNWKATAKDGTRYDMMVEQQLHIIRVGDMLKIARLSATVQPEK